VSESSPRKRGKKEWTIEVEDFPSLNISQRRTLFVCGLDENTTEELRLRGYDICDVRTLPRADTADHAAAIEAWLQGMVEGTIPPDAEKRRTLELESKVHGLLINRSVRLEAKAKLDGNDLEKVLDALASNNRTLKPVTDIELDKAQKSALIPGYQPEDEGIQ